MVSNKESSKSITGRLKVVMFAVAIFFIVSAVGIYLSSLGFLTGLQNINSANIIQNLATQSVESLNTSNESIDQLSTSKSLRDIQFSFNESQKILKRSIQRSILEAHDDQVRKLLESSLDAVFAYEESVNQLFVRIARMPENRSRQDTDLINSELLICAQYSMDAREYLRKAQILLREKSDMLFSTLYKGRFKPLIVAVTLSAFFFLFVIMFGFTTARQIELSVKNLSEATDKVKSGNLTYQASILENDEFGLLTDTFNEMVSSLREGRENVENTLNRIERLQKITAGFSEALTSSEVTALTISEGLDALNAEGGAVYLLTPDEQYMELQVSEGLSKITSEKYKRYQVDIDIPSAAALRTKKALFLESFEEIIMRFPMIENEILRNNIKTVACLPLIVSETSLGVISFIFNKERTFLEFEKDYMSAIAAQCAQALYRSKLYDDAKKAIQIRDEFLSIASHELKTPLTPLKLQLQLLSRQIKSGENLSSEKLEKIMVNSDRQLNRLSKLIEDLLDVSRITSGKLKLNFEKVNLTKLIDDVLVQYGHQLQSALKNVEVIKDEDIVGYLDQMRIEQVLVNLLTNAEKYAPGKPIKIFVNRNGNLAKICIQDQGPGIAKEHQERIFKRFERVKATDNIGGLGLGLYISNQIIEAHKGRIYVESEVGVGSNFIIELPLIQNV